MRDLRALSSTAPTLLVCTCQAPSSDPRRNALLALEDWMEKGHAPSVIGARKYVDDDATKGAQTTRPLCPHLPVAKYEGHGGAPRTPRRA